ncbi:MAG TPA: NIPSNAP family protein [Gemmataceae bacterium]|nr:NIPSNAP family protein [Gemmataceae bacterium]
MRAFWVMLGGVAMVSYAAGVEQGAKRADARVFELRTYTAAPGKMAALNARFRDHTCKLFEKHGMTNIGYWNPADPNEAEKKLVYLLAFPSREAAEKSWQAFRNDPEWKTAREASEKNGRLVEKVESVFLSPTDYSPLK